MGEFKACVRTVTLSHGVLDTRWKKMLCRCGSKRRWIQVTIRSAQARRRRTGAFKHPHTVPTRHMKALVRAMRVDCTLSAPTRHNQRVSSALVLQVSTNVCRQALPTILFSLRNSRASSTASRRRLLLQAPHLLLPATTSHSECPVIDDRATRW
jgi:hypothetical protein